MTSSSALPQRFLIFGIILPIAALVGYLLADPLELSSAAVLGVLIGVLVLPLLLKWHHPLLVVTWHAAIIIIFLPGQPYLWMLLTAINFGFLALNRFLDPNMKIVHVPILTWTLLLLAAVVFATAQYTGGVGLRSLGSSVIGGKKYYLIWFAIAGYFAISARPIPPEKAGLYAISHFGSGITAAISTLAYVAGPAAWVLYAVFPTDYAMHLISKDYTLDYNAIGISRFSGFGAAGLAIAPFFFIRWGVTGLLDWSRPWRMAAFLTVIGVSMLGGFRATLGMFVLLFAIQFWNEGLMKTRYFPALIGFGLVGLVAVSIVASSLPMAIQRSLSVVPYVPLSKIARADAENSTKWRKDMWRELEPEIRRYFWVGKGYTANESTYRLEQEAYRIGLAQDYEMMILAGDYHSGWRSIMVPFGIGGMVAFVAFIGAGLHTLWINRLKGEGVLRRVNMFLLTYFIAKSLYFIFVFGAIASDLFVFTGLVGLSVSLNCGADPARA